MARYLGPEYKIPEVPEALRAEDIVRFKDAHETAVNKVGHLGDNGFFLLEEMEVEYPSRRRSTDRQLPRPRKQILAERVLLLGAGYLVDNHSLCYPHIKFDWDPGNSEFKFKTKIDGGKLKGRALFDTAPTFDARLAAVDRTMGQFSSSHSKMVIINIRHFSSVPQRELKVRGFTPVSSRSNVPVRGKEYFLFVDIHGADGWLYSN